MESIVKLIGIGLPKLNNAEYSNHMTRTHALTAATGAESLGLKAEDVELFGQKSKALQDLVARSMVEAETAEMLALDKQRDTLGRYVIDTAEALCDIPIAAKAEAAQALTVDMKPYKGFHKLPNAQETATINGMLMDLNKEENAARVATLGLTDYVAELMMVNTRYQMLVDQRSMARATDTTDNSKTLRAELDELYDYITTVAFCQSVINPSEATALYVAQMNTYVEETNTAYKQRVAQAKANAEEKEEEAPKGEDTENDETPETPENVEN